MRFILAFTLIFTLKGYTYEDPVDTIIHQRLLEEELQETIKFTDEDRVYFHEEFIHLSSDGIFLQPRSGRNIPIVQLISSSEGCYSYADELAFFGEPFLPTCDVCKKTRFGRPCSNPECPKYQANQERMRQEKLRKEELRREKEERKRASRK